MRHFSLGTPADRKIVIIDVAGPRMIVTRIAPDGATKRTEKTLRTEAEARAVSQQLAGELISRGYVEQRSGGGDDDPANPYDLEEAVPVAAEPVMQRLAPRPSADPGAASSEKKPKKAGGKKKKKKKQAGDPDALDKRVLALFALVGVVLLGGLGYIVWDQFIRPPSIVGTWRGSLTGYEVGSLITHNSYDLILDDQRRASMTQDESTSVGTYTVKGDRLKLTLRGQNDEGELEDEPVETEFKISLGSATLDLMDPESGKLVVQLIRFREPPVIGKRPGKPEQAEKRTASANLASDMAKFDKAEDEKLASVEFSPKDGAFKVRYPPGWEVDTGSRPDNTYSWASFTRDSAKIQVRADIKGSLLSGSDAAFGAQFEEGSELAPVHRAHELYAKHASEDFSEFKVSKPEVLKGSPLGEGRISQFTATESGLFGSKLWGYHATLLTRDRAITILCQCPGKDFPKMKPAFLAVCRSLSR